MLARPMIAGDAENVARLCTQLGYPSTSAQIGQRFAPLDGSSEHGLFVAEADGGEIVGLVHVQVRRLLEEEAFAEIVALVVDGRWRRRHVGVLLVRQAEEWARAAGYGKLHVRSNVVRPEAHDFYPALGYVRVKSQHVYVKVLPETKQ